MLVNTETTNYHSSICSVRNSYLGHTIIEFKCMSKLGITVWRKLPPFRNSLADLSAHTTLRDSSLCSTPALCSSLSSHSALCAGRGLNKLPSMTSSRLALALWASWSIRVFVVFSRKTGVSLLFQYLPPNKCLLFLDFDCLPFTQSTLVFILR